MSLIRVLHFRRSYLLYNSVQKAFISQTAQLLLGNVGNLRKQRPRNDTRRRLLQRNQVERKEGLILSKDQIQRVWNSFEVENDIALDIAEFLEEYPNINPSLKDKLFREENVSANDGSENDGHATLLENQNSIVIEAEEKLQRMLTKIKSQPSIPSSVRNKIQTLLTEELETVIELWIRVANNIDDASAGGCDKKDVSLQALERASALLLQYEAEYVKGLRKSLDAEDDNFFPAVPHTICYQKIISGYHYRHTKRERIISQQDLLRMQSQCSILLKKMVKHILSRRTASRDEENSSSLVVEKRGNFVLNTSYKHLISMYTSRVHLSSYTHGIEMTTLARNLLQEMELHYHDFFTAPSPSEKNQKFLLSIYPTRRIFNSVIMSYSRIAIKFQCPASAQKALEIVNRMEKRYEAYTREAAGPKDAKGGVISPNLTSYKAVLSAFANLDEISIDSLKDLNAMLNIMAKHSNVQFDETMSKLLKDCWSKCSHPQKENIVRDMFRKVCDTERVVKK